MLKIFLHFSLIAIDLLYAYFKLLKDLVDIFLLRIAWAYRCSAIFRRRIWPLDNRNLTRFSRRQKVFWFFHRWGKYNSCGFRRLWNYSGKFCVGWSSTWVKRWWSYKLSEITKNHKRRPNGFWLLKNTLFMSDWWNVNMVLMMVVLYWLVAVYPIEQLEIFYQAGIDL